MKFKANCKNLDPLDVGGLVCLVPLQIKMTDASNNGLFQINDGVCVLKYHISYMRWEEK
jgi:hypothetical protein